MNFRNVSLYLAAMLLLFFTVQHSPPLQTAHAQSTTTPYDCNFTFTFTGTGAQTGVPNSTASRPCVAWRLTYTTTGFSTVTVQFETSPDNITYTAIPNTICSGSTQPPCLSDGASPTTGAQGTAAIRAYGKYVRINVTGVTGSGTGTVVVFGYKGTSASAGIGNGGGPAGPTGPTGPAGPTGPTGPQGPTGPGGGTDLSGSGDFTVVRNSATLLTLGPACSSTNPCRADFGTGTGGTTCTLTTPATATISAGSAQSYIYWSDACVLTVGDNTNTVSCSGCTHASSIAAFPATSIPLWNWTANAGTWDVLGGTNQIKPVGKSADPLANYLISTADAQLKNAVNLGALSTGLVKITVSAGVATPSVVSDILVCSAGLGDGTNAITAATYLQSNCFNKFGGTITINSIECYTDNNGSSTLNATNGAGTALLTGAVTCTNTIPGAAGTQSGTTTIASNDGIKFTFVGDGTSKQTTWTVKFTR